ncbi:MAG TPA: FtsQ-type POTRA domain-containing protein [Thermoanaerobaculia bacterium]|nr:FtsQ-type POTRA domain-containing protein [Thermoanaerobaculia bacterium]
MTVRPREARVLPFRRRRFAVRHKRPSLLRALIKPFLGALLLVGIPVAGVAWMLTSPQFTVKQLKVEGNARVSEGQVEAALSSLKGQHLLLLDLGDVRRQLERIPQIERWTADIDLDKRLPDGLAVKLVERKPAALLRTGGGLFYVDADGETIAPFEAGRDDGSLVVVEAREPDARHVAAAIKVAHTFEAAVPDWGLQLSQVMALGDDDFRLYTAALPFPLLVASVGLESALRRLHKDLPTILRHFPQPGVVDLRFAQRIVLQPAATPPKLEDQGEWPNRRSTS